MSIDTPLPVVAERPHGARRRREVVVQKYGGSSLATLEQLRAVAGRVMATGQGGRDVVVVVSARGRTTDSLLELSRTLATSPLSRESDQLLSTAEASSAAQLAMVLEDLGGRAASLTGGQAGIAIAGPHGEGRITAIEPTRVLALLRSGVVPVVSGFQGVNADGDVITLGRGGSDTTAVAMAAALGASQCEIYTDVDGVFTADPRVVETARILQRVPSLAMAEMSRSGARVLHPRSVDLAFHHGVEVCVRNASTANSGSVLVNEGDISVEAVAPVIAITHDPEMIEVSISLGRDDRTTLPEILVLLADAGVEVDLLAQQAAEHRTTATFTVSGNRIDRARAIFDGMPTVADGAVRTDSSWGKVSIVGSGPGADPTFSARVLRALADARIPSGAMYTAWLRTSVLVPESLLDEAIRVLHDEFGLGDNDDRYLIGDNDVTVHADTLEK